MKGTVYHHTKFGFHDGGIGKKYIILLNSPSPEEPYLFVKTTSQQDRKPAIEGCILTHKVFYLPCKGKYCFKLNTWVQLHEIYPFTASGMVKNGLDKEMTVFGKIDGMTVSQIVNCMISCNGDDILPQHRKLLMSRKPQQSKK